MKDPASGKKILTLSTVQGSDHDSTGTGPKHQSKRVKTTTDKNLKTAVQKPPSEL